MLPALADLEIMLLELRELLDPELRRARPIKLGKPYPIGQCLEIARAARNRLRQMDGSGLTHRAARGFRALRAFQRAGGAFRLVWGDLRGQYFQNAFQLGTLYVDIANDTVVPTKPKIEILPFAAADFSPIADYQHFARIAARYWRHRIFPNHVLPEIAPFCPLIHVWPSGRIALHEISGYMLAMTQAGGFAPSEGVLQLPPIPDDVFGRVVDGLTGGPHELARSPQLGRALALSHCRRAREKRWYRSSRQTAKIVTRVWCINRRLAQWHHGITAEEKPVRILKIDGVDYDLAGLSAEAKAQLQNIQAVDQELARLQVQAAALKTARNVYVGALKAALEAPGSSPFAG
ncbi:hypothetical protein A33M_2003 [Rhodovulum sp. PH10]|uniref:DUF6447 family protein n=1 Tax=Rhodovulum sp. PH10 TaxID=1187851 RepID=UPI00027C2BEA|nr:DUF6447 family protein [Rhodovulum sp. PH10]EJW12432.1 hypothetical protein A33M_2003 [Rhodovulum sp. PH10]